MKTIEELNKKIAYRLIKIIYFVVLLGILLKVGSIYYDQSIIYPYNETKTAITCLNNRDNRVNINKSSYGISGTLTTEQKEKIAREICKIEPTAIYETQSEYSFLTHNNVFIASEGVMEEKFRIFYFVAICILLLVGGAILTEVLRRIVYYVFLGKFNPKRYEDK